MCENFVIFNQKQGTRHYGFFVGWSASRRRIQRLAKYEGQTTSAWRYVRLLVDTVNFLEGKSIR